jgi:hypothetical protein
MHGKWELYDQPNVEQTQKKYRRKPKKSSRTQEEKKKRKKRKKRTPPIRCQNVFANVRRLCEDQARKHDNRENAKTRKHDNDDQGSPVKGFLWSSFVFWV